MQRSFYHSLLQSLGKVGSVLLGAILGTLVAVFLGNHALTFGLITLLVIISCLKLKLQDQIPITLVTAVFMISSQANTFQPYVIMDQVFLALLGSLSALGVNFFFTPKHNQELEDKVKKIDVELRNMLTEINKRIQNPPAKKAPDFMEKLKELRDEASKGIQLSKLFQEEQKFSFTQETIADIYRKQFVIFEYLIDYIEEMYRLSNRINTEVPQAKQIAKLIRVINHIQKRTLDNKNNFYSIVDRSILNLEEQYDNMPLPSTREEFKSRASLYHIFKETKRYYKKIKELPAKSQ